MRYEAELRNGVRCMFEYTDEYRRRQRSRSPNVNVLIRLTVGAHYMRAFWFTALFTLPKLFWGDVEVRSTAPCGCVCVFFTLYRHTVNTSTQRRFLSIKSKKKPDFYKIGHVSYKACCSLVSGLSGAFLQASL